MGSGATPPSPGPTRVSASLPLPGVPCCALLWLCPSWLPCWLGGGRAHLQWEDHQRHADHDDHQQLGRPDLGCHVAVAHRGEGDDAEVEGCQEGQVLARSLQVLDATGPARPSSQGVVGGASAPSGLLEGSSASP